MLLFTALRSVNSNIADSFRFMVWVAPSFFANSRDLGFPPTAMIFAQLAIFAAIIALIPTVPQPNTAIEEPNFGFR